MWSDKASDWNTDFTSNYIIWIELFLKLEIDMLILFTLAGGLSRFNPIELIWGFINSKLAGKKFGTSFSQIFEKK